MFQTLLSHFSNGILKIAESYFNASECFYDYCDRLKHYTLGTIFYDKVAFLSIYKNGVLDVVYEYDTFPNILFYIMGYIWYYDALYSVHDIEKLADYSYITRYYEGGKCIVNSHTPHHHEQPPKKLPYAYVILNDKEDITDECTEIWNFIHDDKPITVSSVLHILKVYHHHKSWVLNLESNDIFLKVLHSETLEEHVFKANDHLLL